MLARTVFIVLAAVMLVAVTPAAVAGSDRVTLDADTPLTEQRTLSEYNDQGVVHADLARLDMAITIADDATDAGLNGWTHASSVNTYLRIQYNESIERTLRFYVPDAYWTPRVKAGLRPTAADKDSENTRLTLEPAGDGAYTAVTIHVTGPTDATFGIGRATGTLFDFRAWTSGIVNNTTGIKPPSLGGGGEEWSYVPERSLTGSNTTYAITVPSNHDPDEYTVQYDNDLQPGEEQTEWLPLPRCTDGNAHGVCRFQKEGASQTVFILSTGQDPPRIRHASSPGAVSRGNSIIDQLSSVPGRIWEDLNALWPGQIVAARGVV